jgi:hypothetical protein
MTKSTLLAGTCWAYRDDGEICGAVAVAIDERRGYGVCAKHLPGRDETAKDAAARREKARERLRDRGLLGADE